MTALHEATGFSAPAPREHPVPVPRQRIAGERHAATPAGARRIPAPRTGETGRHARVRAAARQSLAAAEVDALEAAYAAPARRPQGSRPARPARRLPRRPSVLLAAVVAGGLLAGFWGIAGGSDAGTTTSVLAAQEALVAQDELEAMPMAAITEAEAKVRLAEVAASRKERADAKAEAEAARLAAIEAARPKTVLPVQGATLTSTFGPRWGTFHYGIDLAGPMHTPEYAAADGVVLRAGSASGFGLAVYILHENGDVTVYGHMDEILVSPGDYVEAGDTIALLGNTGQSTGPHLHFEVHQGGEDGTRIDPIAWLAERGVQL